MRNPSCIDIFLTNSNKSFQNTSVIPAGMLDHHKMIVTVMKTTFLKAKHWVTTHRSYKNFDMISFKRDSRKKLYSHAENINQYQLFEGVFLNVLEKH